MIRNLLATTAIAALLATSAYAQETNTNNATGTQPAATTTQDPAAATGQNAPLTEVNGHLASNMIGETVYNGTNAEAENIGEVNDLVVSKEGKIESLIIGVGGFLGIGERDVAIPFEQAQWADRDGDRLLVVQATKQQLEGMQPFDKAPYQPAQAVAAAANTAADTAAGAAGTVAGAAGTVAGATVAAGQTAADATTNAAGGTAATDQTAQNAAPAANATTDANGTQAPATAANQNADTTQTAAIDRSQLKEVPAGEMRAEDIVGTTVYGANDANVGEIGDVVLTADGKVDAYLLDVGGFLGMGEKEVAISADKLSFMQDANGNRYLYTTFSKEQLEAQAAYDEGSYAQNRDQMRMNVQQQ